MAKTLFLKAQTRKNIGRAGVKAVRRTGNVPGILYGKKTSPQPIEINERELKAALHQSTSENVLVDLELVNDSKSEKHLALVQDVQHHPLEDYIIHIDFQAIAQDEKLHTEVSVQSVGEPLGTKSGGIFETLIRTLRVECLPKDLPDNITVDVSALAIGQSIHVGDIKLPSGVNVLNAKELTVFAVAAPKEEEVAPTTAAAVEQPEVINEKKTEDGAAAEGKADGKADAKADGKKDAKKEAKK